MFTEHFICSCRKTANYCIWAIGKINRKVGVKVLYKNLIFIIQLFKSQQILKLEKKKSKMKNA